MASPQTIAFVAAMSVCGMGVAGLSLRGEPPRRLKFDAASSPHLRVTAPELASWIIEGKRDFAVVDMRANQDFEAGSIRDAVHCGSCHEEKAVADKAQEDHFVDLSKKLVLYTQHGNEALQLPKIIAHNPRLYFLEGGYQSWKETILAPTVVPANADEATTLELRKHEAMRAFFSGESVVSTPAQLPTTPIRRENAHQGAVAREGC